MPNDPGYNQQWGLQKIRAPLAWNSSQGNGVLVAVVDTGVDLNHKDLRKNIRLRRGRGKNFLLGYANGQVVRIIRTSTIDIGSEGKDVVL